MTSQTLEKRFNELTNKIEASQIEADEVEIKIQAIKQAEERHSVGFVTINADVSYAAVQIDGKTCMAITHNLYHDERPFFSIVITQNEIPVFATVVWEEESMGEKEAIIKAVRRFITDEEDTRTEELPKLEERLIELKKQIDDSRIEVSQIASKIEAICDLMSNYTTGPVHQIKDGSNTLYSRVHINSIKYIITIHQLRGSDSIPGVFYLGVVAIDGIPVFVHKFQPRDWNKIEIVNDIVREFVIHSINADEDSFAW